MGKETLMDKLRDVIGAIGFRLLLWANRMTAEQYFERVFEEHILAKYCEGELDPR